jgi:hypothetical protein
VVISVSLSTSETGNGDAPWFRVREFLNAD